MKNLKPVKMRPIDLRLRCFAHKEPDNSWFAMCIDLNLCTQSDTLQKAQGKLHSMIKEYLQEAFTGDKKHLGDLMPRRAPLYFIFRYHWIGLRIEIAKKISIKKRLFNTVDKLFVEYLPLVPQLNGR